MHSGHSSSSKPWRVTLVTVATIGFIVLLLNWGPTTTHHTNNAAIDGSDSRGSRHKWVPAQPSACSSPAAGNVPAHLPPVTHSDAEAQLAIVSVITVHTDVPQIIAQYHAVESFLAAARSIDRPVEITLVLLHPPNPRTLSLPPWLQWPDIDTKGPIRFRALTLTKEAHPDVTETEAFLYGVRESHAKRVVLVRDLAALSTSVVSAALTGNVPAVSEAAATAQLALHTDPAEILSTCERAAAAGGSGSAPGQKALLGAATVVSDRDTLIQSPASAAESDPTLSGLTGVQLRLLLTTNLHALAGHVCLPTEAAVVKHSIGSAMSPVGALAGYQPLFVHGRVEQVADLSQLFVFGYNPEDPYTLFPHHLIFSSYLNKGWVGELEPGFIRDNLGLRTSHKFDCQNTERYRLWHLSRRVPCDRFDLFVKMGAKRYRPDLPIMDEEYFEWVDDLGAAVEASKQRGRGLPYVAIELGARYGTWAGRAVKAFQTLRPQHPVIAVSVEADETGFNWLTEHGPNNGYTGDSWVKIKGALGDQPGVATFNGWEDNVARQVNVMTMAQILEKYEYVDIMHIDVQGAETNLEYFADILNKKVRRVHIGTHSRGIQDRLLNWLRHNKWQITFNIFGGWSGDHANTQDYYTEYGLMRFYWDGIMAAVNPNVQLPK